MAAAYRGTVDDLGENDAWHLAQAERTLRGDFGAVVREASLVVAEDGFAGTCLVTENGAHLLLVSPWSFPSGRTEDWAGRSWPTAPRRYVQPDTVSGRWPSPTATHLAASTSGWDFVPTSHCVSSPDEQSP